MRPGSGELKKVHKSSMTPMLENNKKTMLKIIMKIGQSTAKKKRIMSSGKWIFYRIHTHSQKQTKKIL
jgi:hypothetical protein